MREKINNIVIVGNGFDLHHGLRTSYNDFYEQGLCEKNREKVDKLADNLKYVEFKNWHDFEELYRRAVKEIANKVFSNGGWNEKNIELYCESIYQINELFSLVRIDLQKYFKNVEKDIINIANMDKCISKSLKNADTIINFNYTPTIEKIYGISKDRIKYIHGEIENSSIILGHSNYYAMDEKNADFGLGYIAQDLSKNSYIGNFYTIDASIGKEKKPNSPLKPIEHSNPMYNIMFGDKTIQKLSRLNPGFNSMNMMDLFYNEPFAEKVGKTNIKNDLYLNVEENVLLTIIGHGLNSDKDLLSKLPNIKCVKLFCRNNVSKSDINKIRDLFNVDSENIIEQSYEWE